MRITSPTRPWVAIIIALLLVVVILFLGSESFKATERAAFDEFNQRQLILAREAAGGIELYFETLAGDLRALAGMPEIQYLDEVPARREIQHTFDRLEPLGVNDVGLLDAEGTLRYTAVADQIEGEDFSWRRYYQEARRTTSSETYVIEFIEFRGVEVGQEGVLVAVPLFETATDENYPTPSGRFAGVVLCTLRLDTVTERFVAPVRSSERGHTFLIDDDYDVLWAADTALFGRNLLEAGEGFPTFLQVVERMGEGHSGTAEYSYYKFEDAAGEYVQGAEEKLIAHTAIPLGNEVWSIGVWAPKDEARQLIRSAYYRQLFVVGLSVLTILLGSLYSLVTSSRTSMFLEQEVEAKTAELAESHGRLRMTLDSLEVALAFQQSVIDGVSEPIMVIGMDHRVALMNRAAREFSSGIDTAQLPLCYQMSHRRETPCDGTDHPCPLDEVLRSGQPVTVIHEHYQANGELRIVEVIAAPRWGADGALQGIIESVRDITERRRAAEALHQHTERLRALAAQLDEVAEVERQRLARELHDQVGQNLTALGINLNIVRTQIPEQAPAQLRSRLDDSLSLVEQTAERIRDVMANLRPPVLDDYGLVAALRWYGERFSWRTDIAVAVEGEEPVPRLLPRAENALFRIAQEALINVVKHAQATVVTVTVEVDDKSLRLVIADNGIGFDSSNLPGPADNLGWGLLTMSERAEAIGGRYHLESHPGQGTQVSVEAPR